jgi:proteasome beta subunit
MTMTEARNLVIRAVKSATARDIASGNGLDLLIITKNESKEENIQL